MTGLDQQEPSTTTWTHESAQPWVDRWDTLMTGYWPWRDDVHGTVLDLLDRLGPCRRVLDLGACVGSFAGRLANLRPSCQVTALDWDPLVLGLARAHLRGRADVLEADLTRVGLAAVLGVRFDVVVTNAVMHVFDASIYAGVVTEIATVLRPGGVFVDVDQMPLPPCSSRLAAAATGLRDDRSEAWFGSGHEDFAAWMDDLRRQPESSSLLALHHERLGDRPEGRVARADERVAALREAGFNEVAEVERRLDTSVLVAIR